MAEIIGIYDYTVIDCQRAAADPELPVRRGWNRLVRAMSAGKCCANPDQPWEKLQRILGDLRARNWRKGTCKHSKSGQALFAARRMGKSEFLAGLDSCCSKIWSANGVA
jgi:hypothetical protein